MVVNWLQIGLAWKLWEYRKLSELVHTFITKWQRIQFVSNRASASEDVKDVKSVKGENENSIDAWPVRQRNEDMEKIALGVSREHAQITNMKRGRNPIQRLLRMYSRAARYYQGLFDNLGQFFSHPYVKL